jgi:uroporphyrin-III C-methyltransferase
LSGIVYLVGAGPGAPDLLTVREARVLARADAVFYDALVHPEVVALAERADRIAVGKRCGRHSTAQRFINKRLVDAARTGATVVRLKGGDPLLFGRAQEEIDALTRAGVAFEVVPGVSAGFAASAALGVSLTERGVARSVVFATPRIGDSARSWNPRGWVESVLAADTAALYMAGEHAAEVASELIARGKSGGTPVVVVASASLPDQHVHATKLGALARGVPGRATGPTLLLVGEVYGRCVASVLTAGALSARGTSARASPRALP